MRGRLCATGGKFASSNSLVASDSIRRVPTYGVRSRRANKLSFSQLRPASAAWGRRSEVPAVLDAFVYIIIPKMLFRAMSSVYDLSPWYVDRGLLEHVREHARTLVLPRSSGALKFCFCKSLWLKLNLLRIIRPVVAWFSFPSYTS
jgi:hypothetical protein